MKINQNQTTTSRAEFFYYTFRNILLVSLPLVVVSGLVLSHLSLHSSAVINSSADHLDFSIPVSCTLSSNIESAHSATLLNGTYKDDIGKTILTAYCNDQNGYTIYASAMSKNNLGQSVLVSSNNSNDDIVTSTATSGNTSAWAMKLNNIEGDTSPTPPTIEPGYLNTYTVVPNTWTKVASKSNGTVNSQTGSSFTTTYAVYTSTTQPAGSYTGLVRYMLLHDNQTIPTPTYFMQDVAFWKDDLTLNQSVQAIDERDGKKYWVTKLADGNIWMTQNLDLDITAGSTMLTSDNTDLSTYESAYTDANTIYALKGEGDAYGYTYENGIATWVPERSTIAYDQLNSTSWPNSAAHPYSYDRLDTSPGDNNGKPVYPDSKVSQVMAGDHGLSGNYYNWTASLASNDSTKATGNPVNSICPKGWRLPNITDKEFGNLLVDYDIIQTNISTTYLDGGFNAMTSVPLYFVRGGRILGGSLGDSGNGGGYWSSTFQSRSYAYYFYFYSGNLYPQFYDDRGRGFPVRCLAR